MKERQFPIDTPIFDPHQRKLFDAGPEPDHTRASHFKRSRDVLENVREYEGCATCKATGPVPPSEFGFDPEDPLESIAEMPPPGHPENPEDPVAPRTKRNQAGRISTSAT